MAKAYIIDGNSLLFRAYYATAYQGVTNIMRTSYGVPTNAVFAFSNMFDKILSELNHGDYLFVAFDTGKKTFRHKEDAEYKANRKPAPHELIEQMPIVREMLRSLNIFTYEKEGFEADDLCGTVSKEFSKAGIKVTVYTSDQDFLQLIDENVQVNLLKTGLSKMNIINEEEMLKQYGFTPKQLIDYKGLRGDVSDNLKGIPGVGEKTARNLLSQYGSLEKIIEEAPNIKGKLGENILLHQEEGKKCKHLATIQTEIKLPFHLDTLIYEGYSFDIAKEFATKYELTQFLKRLPRDMQISNEEMSIDVINVDSFDDLNFDDKIGLSLDIEDGNYMRADIYGIVISNGKKEYYLKEEDIKKDAKLKALLEDPNIKKYCYDYKSIKVALKRYDITLNGLAFDMLLAAYLLDSSNKNSLIDIMRYFGLDIENDIDNTISIFGNSNPKKAAKVAHYALKEAEKIRSELSKKECLKLYDEVEIPLTSVLAKMEIEGVPLNLKELEEIGSFYQEKLDNARSKIYQLAGEEFNIDSPKQVGEILYNKLKIPTKNKNSTSVEVLNEIKNLHPIVNEILTYRKYAKLVSTYVNNLRSHLFSDGKIHAIFNQALTATGRLSMSDPNLQNISINDEEGKLIRKAFHYEDKDNEILSLDYSQIELRILASLSNSKSLIEVFENGYDVHSATAKKLFGISNPSQSERRKAKAINFGIIYGISDWGLSEQIMCSPKEAHAIIDGFYKAYPEIDEYFQNVTAFALKNGYVTTLFGRRRYLEEVHATNYQVREFARRAAMNAPIQGTAADLIKIAMIQIDKVLEEKKLKTRLILQIHDELLFKVPNEEKEIVLPILKNIMENAIKLNVKLNVDGGFGKTWYDAK